MNVPEPARGRLPAGRHGLPRHFVVSNQRERILLGVAQACERMGYRAMTVDEITQHAGVSRRTFYDLFTNKEQAFLAACDEIVSRLLAAIAEASEEADSFGESAVAGLEVLFDMASNEPALARMVLVEVMAAGPEAARRRNAAVDSFAALVNHYAEAELAEPPPLLTAEMVVGGIYEAVFRRVVSGNTRELHSLLPELVFTALLPYTGLDEATAVRAHAQRRALHR